MLIPLCAAAADVTPLHTTSHHVTPRHTMSHTRETHHISGAAVKMAEDRGVPLSSLSVADLQSIHPDFEDDVVKVGGVFEGGGGRGVGGGGRYFGLEGGRDFFGVEVGRSRLG